MHALKIRTRVDHGEGTSFRHEDFVLCPQYSRLSPPTQKRRVAFTRKGLGAMLRIWKNSILGLLCDRVLMQAPLRKTATRRKQFRVSDHDRRIVGSNFIGALNILK